MPTTELLAPARDLVCGLAALDCGADAVYIGAPRFGARAKAGNALADIATLAEHAHTYWARVYVTVNTLLHDHELPAAVALIHNLYEIGVDGVIIQDVGLLECDLPPIPLIASTQLHNNTPEKVAFLEQVGFQRVILARELGLGEIQAIRQQSSVTLEAFVHGALCVSYSGQCYMSYAIGGRSGNRGECAQPCRRAYTLVDADGKVLVERKFLLSLRDLNRSADLGALLDVGVTSFKIEGRLKDVAYVKNVVAAYRQALDAARFERGFTRSSSGYSDPGFVPDLDKTFNRGYTPYFLHARQDAPGSIDTPKMVGELLGEVAGITARSFTLDAPIVLHSGDGLCFFDDTDTLTGTVVNRAEDGVITPNEMGGIRVGRRIYRNRDHAFIRTVERAQPERKITVTLHLAETTEGFALTATDEDGISATALLPADKVLARKPDQALANVERQLSKTGGTPFNCTAVHIDWSRPYFLPFSTLNALRRDALDALLEARAHSRPIETGGALQDEVPYPIQSLTYLGNVLKEQAAAFYRRHGVDDIEPAAESGLDLHEKRVMRTRYCLRRQLGACLREGNLPGFKEPLYLVDENRHRYRLRFDCEACEMEVFF